MKIPKQFSLGGATWSVHLVSDSMSHYGWTDKTKNAIYVVKTGPKDRQEHTFCHELVHAVLWSMGKDTHEEEFVDAFATFLHQAIKTFK